MYEWEDEEGAKVGSRGRSVIIGAIVVAAAALGWFVVRPALSDDEDAATDQTLVFDDLGLHGPRPEHRDDADE